MPAPVIDAVRRLRRPRGPVTEATKHERMLARPDRRHVPTRSGDPAVGSPIVDLAVGQRDTARLGHGVLRDGPPRRAIASSRPRANMRRTSPRTTTSVSDVGAWWSTSSPTPRPVRSMSRRWTAMIDRIGEADHPQPHANERRAGESCSQRSARSPRRHGVPYLLDACQTVGQMPIDVGADRVRHAVCDLAQVPAWVRAASGSSTCRQLSPNGSDPPLVELETRNRVRRITSTCTPIDGGSRRGRRTTQQWPDWESRCVTHSTSGSRRSGTGSPSSPHTRGPDSATSRSPIEGRRYRLGQGRDRLALPRRDGSRLGA